MTRYLVAVFHNTDSRFAPYEPDHTLAQVFSCFRHLSAVTVPEDCAEWAFDVFNADLEMLERSRETPDGEADFIVACTYRLLGLRSLSAGDVIAVTAESHTTWVACEYTGWRRIPAPERFTGRPLTAATIIRHLRRGNHA